jgi:hypothetical protein
MANFLAVMPHVTRCWDEYKFDHGSRRGPKPRMAGLARTVLELPIMNCDRSPVGCVRWGMGPDQWVRKRSRHIVTNGNCRDLHRIQCCHTLHCDLGLYGFRLSRAVASKWAIIIRLVSIGRSLDTLGSGRTQWRLVFAQADLRSNVVSFAPRLDDFNFFISRSVCEHWQLPTWRRLYSPDKEFLPNRPILVWPSFTRLHY